MLITLFPRTVHALMSVVVEHAWMVVSHLIPVRVPNVTIERWDCPHGRGFVLKPGFYKRQRLYLIELQPFPFSRTVGWGR